MRFGERLKEARKSKGFTQADLAEKIGVAKPTYNGYEKDNREPDLFKIKLLIEVLEVDSSWLLGVNQNRIFTQHETAIIKKYRQLDQRGQTAVDRTLEGEWQLAQSEKNDGNCDLLPDRLV